MDNILLIKNRYLVPFMFFPKHGQTFNNLVDEISCSGEWLLRDAQNRDIECDLYSTLLNSFTMNESQNNIGCEFLYTGVGSAEKNILTFNYTKFKKDFVVTITEMGLFLFRTGVGFIWHEITVPQDASFQELILFQNEFKELSYERFISLNNKQGRYTFEDFENKQKGILLGDWINVQMNNLPWKYQYFAERPNPLETSQQIPDKALIYSYGVFEDIAKEDLLKHLYHMTNGYNEKYKVHLNFEDTIIEPFENAYCYASMSNSGYYVIPEQTNKKFYLHTFSRRIMADYFLLYVLALYQSYSLLKFTTNIETQLSAESEKYLKDSKEILEILERTETEINVFLIKSVYSSVSHIEHQNDYFEYLIRRQKIQENIDGLTIGLESLHKLQEVRERKRIEEIESQENQEREKLNDRLNIGLGLISIFALLSAIVDGEMVISLISNYFGLSEKTHQILNVCGFVAVLTIAFVVGTSLITSSIRKRYKKR